MEMEDLYELDEKEVFLKRFLRSHPVYRTKTILEEGDHEVLMEALREEWEKEFPQKPFFLKGSSSHIPEDFFIPQGENASVFRSLRYMPLFLHSHQFIEVNMVFSSGKSQMLMPSKSLPLEDGDILLCPPGLTHCFQAFCDESVILDMFLRVSTFDSAFFGLLNSNTYLAGVFSNALYSPKEECVLWHCPGDDLLKELFLAALGEYESHEKYKGRMVELRIMEFFVQLLRRHEAEATFPFFAPLSDADQYQAMLNFMAAHLSSITLGTLAEQYNYSERQMIRLLKKYSGKSFSDLLLELRMKKAKVLLENPSLSLGQISQILGFSTATYFSRVFEKYYGYAPKGTNGGKK